MMGKGAQQRKMQETSPNYPPSFYKGRDLLTLGSFNKGWHYGMEDCIHGIIFIPYHMTKICFYFAFVLKGGTMLSMLELKNSQPHHEQTAWSIGSAKEEMKRKHLLHEQDQRSQQIALKCSCLFGGLMIPQN